MQGGFSTLVGLFDWVGLRTNAGKIVVMVFRPCQAAGTQSEAAYKRWMTGTVPSYQDTQQVQIQWTILPGETASASVVFGVQGGDSIGISVSTLTETA